MINWWANLIRIGCFKRSNGCSNCLFLTASLTEIRVRNSLIWRQNHPCVLSHTDCSVACLFLVSLALPLLFLAFRFGLDLRRLWLELCSGCVHGNLVLFIGIWSILRLFCRAFDGNDSSFRPLEAHALVLIWIVFLVEILIVLRGSSAFWLLLHDSGLSSSHFCLLLIIREDREKRRQEPWLLLYLVCDDRRVSFLVVGISIFRLLVKRVERGIILAISFVERSLGHRRLLFRRIIE